MTRRALLIGCGERGRQWAAAVNDHPHWRVAGLVDPDPEARGKLAAEFGVQRELTVPDLDALDVSQPEWDAVIVATPPDLHVEPARWAVDHGKAVLVEKPFATSLTEAAELVEKAEAAGVPLMVGQNYRYLRMNQAVRRVVDSGSLGRIGMVVAPYYHPPENVPPTPKALRHSALWGMAVHYLGALTYVLRCKVRDNLATVAVLEACVRSTEERRWVGLEEIHAG